LGDWQEYSREWSISVVPSTVDLRAHRADRLRASLTSSAITGIAVIGSGTGISRCCTRLQRHRQP
jgi:hypothetical protein